MILLVACAGSPPVTDVSSRVSLCGVSFALAAPLAVSGQAVPEEEEGLECLILASRDPRPAGPDRADPDGAWDLAIAIHARALDDAAAAAGFERTAGGWIVRGRHGIESPADTISGPGWTGVRGIAQVGAFDDRGYAGLEESPRAVLSDGRGRSVVVDARPRAEDAFELLLRTLRFTR